MCTTTKKGGEVRPVTTVTAKGRRRTTKGGAGGAGGAEKKPVVKINVKNQSGNKQRALRTRKSIAKKLGGRQRKPSRTRRR